MSRERMGYLSFENQILGMCKIGLAPGGLRKGFTIDSQIYYSTQQFSHSIAHKVGPIRTRMLSHLAAPFWVVQKRPTNHPHMLHHRSAGLIQQWTCVQRRERVKWSFEPFLYVIGISSFFFFIVSSSSPWCVLSVSTSHRTHLSFSACPLLFFCSFIKSFIAPRLESEFLTLFALAVNKLSSYRIQHTNRARGEK